jgi:2-C-methyl-D-erythritol 4-phosphate cytidylyltransferase
MGEQLSTGRGPTPVVSVVLAGGVGSRFGDDVPKQLADLAGRPILYHALRAFDDESLADLVVIPANPAWYAEIKSIAEDALRRVQYTIVEGGDARNTSVAYALTAIPFDQAKVLIHDGVRPLVTSSLIRRVTLALDTASCVIPAIPSIDPVIRVGKRTVKEFYPRSDTLRGQSPQGFWLTQLREVFQAQDTVAESRDTVFELLLDFNPGAVLHHVAGDLNNIKVTMPIDRAVATAILSQLDRDRDDSSEYPVVGARSGSVVIPRNIGGR